MKPSRRRFGSVRRLPSGRFQIRYPGPGGRVQTGDRTYEKQSEAEKALVLVEAKLSAGGWSDPQRAKVKLADYAARWITQRPNLRPRTIEIYCGLLRRFIAPHLGSLPLDKIDTATVREWRITLLADGVGQSEVAKAYRLLRAVLMTAADDWIIPRNPCRIRGAGEEKPAERPVLTIDQVFRLINLMPERVRALVLFVAFTGLRWGEAVALRRMDVNLESATVSVRLQQVELDTGELVICPPKSRAGVRTVAFPAAIIPALREHMDKFAGPDAEAPIFTGSTGRPWRRSNFRRYTKWQEAVSKIGVPGLHFHDLRHTGNHLAASSGASLRDLMQRMGHDSVRAAMIYQHSTQEADRRIAGAMDDKIRQAGQAGPMR